MSYVVSRGTRPWAVGPSSAGSRPFTVRDLVADVPLPDHTNVLDVLPVLKRGRREVAMMIESSLSPEALRTLAWQPQP